MRASLLASAWAVSWVPMLSHTASSPFPGSPQEGPMTFSPQLTQRVLQKTRLRRSELADLIHVLLTPFNNHYFTLTAFFRSTAGGRRSQCTMASCWRRLRHRTLRSLQQREETRPLFPQITQRIVQKSPLHGYEAAPLFRGFGGGREFGALGQYGHYGLYGRY